MAKQKPSKGRIRVNFYLEPEQKDALERLTKVTRVPWSEYVREGVDMVLDRYKRHLKRTKK